MTLPSRAPFAGICHQLRGWCAANGCRYISALVLHDDWAEAVVMVDADTWLVGCGANNDEIIAMLKSDLTRNMAQKRRREWRLIEGGAK